ncbi:MAG: trypsin [Hydrogenophilales bacterium RIFOXYD1_FULL_62_11]|nr:MAG: trypsin [Hydrogenophilales bacterium RIFOXYD1_FULL_62_11]
MKRGLFFLLACVLFFTAAYAFAEDDCGDCDRSLAPRLWIPDGDPATDRLPLKSSQANVMIDGPIARVTVTQRYGNAGTRPINARYVFPGSTRAAVQGLTMKIGPRTIRAKIKEKEEAKKIFEAAKQAGKHAALLEQKRPNVFMMDVANIMPGDEVELTLQYSELLVPDQGVYELVCPTVVGPRYGGNPVQAAQETEWVASPYAKNKADGGNPARIETGIHVLLASPIPVSDLRSVQHKIATNWLDDKRVEVSLDASERDAGNRDFILRFRLQGEQINSGLMTYEWNGEHYFLMMAQPPKRVEAAQVMKREYLFVVDVSGSMHGFPLDTAREVMRELLGKLRPEESFNILFFSGGSTVLSSVPLPATPANLQRAMDMMKAYNGGGGTELVPALEKAYDMPRTPDMARSIVVVTDGYISAERAAYDLIRQNLNATNLFAFGIGSSVNRHLIESMAHVGEGEPFVITGPGEVDGVGERFRRYVETPVLSHINVQGNGVELYDMEPAEIPVMLAERPIVVFGKYRHAQTGASLELSGTAAQGDYRANLPLAGEGSRNQAELLPVLWARQRLMRLSDRQGGDVELNRDAIVDLGLRYSLLTQYTAFVAVDETVVNQGADATDVKQPLPLPQGVSELALAQPVPEPELGWLMLLLAGLFGGERLIRARGHGKR